MIVYLTRDIAAFVMYCVNGESGSFLLIESTDSISVTFCLILILPTLVHSISFVPVVSVHRFLSKSVLLNMVVNFFFLGVDRAYRHSISAASLSLTTQIHSYLTQLSAL